MKTHSATMFTLAMFDFFMYHMYVHTCIVTNFYLAGADDLQFSTLSLQGMQNFLA